MSGKIVSVVISVLILLFLFPTSGTAAWMSSTPIPGGINNYAFAQCWGDGSDSFYIISGANSSLQLSDKIWRFDHHSGAGTWTDLGAPIPFPVQGAAATCYMGKIYVAGGAGADGLPSRRFQIYNIFKSKWTKGKRLPRSAFGAGLAAWKGKIYLIGGVKETSNVGLTIKGVHRYLIDKDRWSNKKGKPAPVSTYNYGYVQMGRSLFISGGWNDSSPGLNVSASLLYNLGKDRWTTGPSFTSARANLPLAATWNKLWTYGGDTPGGTFFDPSTTLESLTLGNWILNNWTADADSLPTARQGNKGGFCTNRSDGSGEIWSVGGSTDATTVIQSVEYKITDRCSLLLFNSSFEAGNGQADGWMGQGLDAGDQRDNTRSRWGDYSFRIGGSMQSKWFYQDIPATGSAGDRYIVSGWNRNDGTRRRGGPTRIYVTATYLDDSQETWNFNFPKRSHGWKNRNWNLNLPLDYKNLRFGVQVRDQAGETYWDGLQLSLDYKF